MAMCADPGPPWSIGPCLLPKGRRTRNRSRNLFCYTSALQFPQKGDWLRDVAGNDFVILTWTTHYDYFGFAGSFGAYEA